MVDVSGLVVAPGFIDIHTHARRGIFEIPTADNYVRQGVTTLVEGPDGGSDVPLQPFLERVATARITPNFATFIGQGSIRSEVVGSANRAATADELERMRGLVRQGMEQGAFGLSSGLFYVPGTFTPTDEVVELAKVAGRMGGIYISHMRDEAGGVVDSVRETIAIGERGGLPTQVTHHKVIGQEELGPIGRHAEADRRGARARRGRDHRHVSLHRLVHQHPGGAAAGVGAGRRTGGADEAPATIRRRARRSRRRAPPSSATSAAAAIRRTSSRRAAASTPRWPERISPRSPPSAGCR